MIERVRPARHDESDIGCISLFPPHLAAITLRDPLVDGQQT